MTDEEKAFQDAVLHGKGFMLDGEYVPFARIYDNPVEYNIDALRVKNWQLCDALAKLITVVRFEVPAIRDGVEALRRLDILESCADEAHATLQEEQSK